MLTTTLPPPFNIIPTYVGIQPVIEYVKLLLKPPPDKRARWDMKHCCYIVSVIYIKITMKHLYNFFKFLYVVNFNIFFLIQYKLDI